MRSRGRQRTTASAYRATRSPPEDPSTDPRDVAYPVTLVRDDAEWIATVDALPGCNARGSSPDEAIERVAAAAAAWVETAGREGKEIPEPKSAQSHSGRLLLRMPQTLHAELARAAERERVSLNQFITDALSGALGWRAPNRDTPGATRVVPEEGLDREATASPGPRGSRVGNAVLIANGVIVAVVAVIAIIVLIATLR